MATVTRLRAPDQLASSITTLSSKFELLDTSLSLHPDKQYLRDKKQLLERTSQLSHKILTCIPASFSTEQSPSILSNAIKEEQASQSLVQTLSKEFDRLNLNALSALNLESPVHGQQKKHSFPIIEALNLEIKKTDLTLELNTLGFNPLSSPEERLATLQERCSRAYSYLTTPLRHIAFSRKTLNSELKVSVPKGTRKFVQLTLKGSCVRLKGELGKGAFGIIHLVQIGNKHFAVKKPLITSDKDKNFNDKVESYFKKETSLHMHLRHPNIVNVVALSPQGLYLEFMNDGDLWKVIDSPDLKPGEVKEYLLGIVEGLIYLNENGYTHRDLKPENILISKKFARAKLCDFGFTTLTKSDTLQVGSLLYVAPEIKYNTGTEIVDPISNKADIWSLGVVMFEMITGGIHPYPLLCTTESALSYSQRLNTRLNKPCNGRDIFRIVDNYKPTKNLMRQRDPTGTIRSLIVQCLHGDPTKRISAQEVKTALNALTIPPKQKGLFSFLF